MPQLTTFAGAPAASSLQPAAVSAKSTASETGEDKPNPLPAAATGCREEYMVRGRSTVLVEQAPQQRHRLRGAAPFSLITAKLAVKLKRAYDRATPRRAIRPRAHRPPLPSRRETRAGG
jgi:hypothetical protein